MFYTLIRWLDLHVFNCHFRAICAYLEHEEYTEYLIG